MGLTTTIKMKLIDTFIGDFCTLVLEPTLPPVLCSGLMESRGGESGTTLTPHPLLCLVAASSGTVRSADVKGSLCQWMFDKPGQYLVGLHANGRSNPRLWCHPVPRAFHSHLGEHLSAFCLPNGTLAIMQDPVTTPSHNEEHVNPICTQTHTV